MEALHQLPGLGVDDLFLEFPATHEDVLRHSQVRAEVDLLEHGGDAHFDGILGTGGRDLLPVEDDGARVLVVDARQAFDEGGFARAVLAQQRVDLTGAQEEIHPVQRLYAGELDLYAPHFEYVFRQCNSSFIETMGNWE